MRLRILALSAVVALSGLAAPMSTRAADLGGATPPSIEVLDVAAIEAELTRYAVLYTLRAAFNAIEPDEIEPLLRSELARLSSGDSAEARAALESDLIAEGSYYVVSLRYLVAFGGANWPVDRPSADYSRDARVLLEALQARWLAAVPTGEDLVPIMQEIDAINAWTEGYAALPPELDRFSAIPAMVRDLVAKYGPQTGA
jgi:hypothetical protein